MKKYWQNAVGFPQYLKDTEQKIKDLEKSTDPQDQIYLNYYQLGLTRMKRVLKTFTPLVQQQQILEEKDFKGKILIISEGWCGDAAMIIPVIYRLFEGKNEIKITYRDQSNLIDNYLTHGGKSIPIVLILNEKDEVISHWGPRPKYGMELLKKHKTDPGNYTSDDFHNDLQVYYTKNKGQDIIDELLKIL